MNKRGNNYNKALKLTTAYYINTNPLVGFCQFIRLAILKINKNKFKKLYKMYKANNTNTPFNDKNIKE